MFDSVAAELACPKMLKARVPDTTVIPISTIVARIGLIAFRDFNIMTWLVDFCCI